MLEKQHFRKFCRCTFFVACALLFFGGCVWPAQAFAQSESSQQFPQRGLLAAMGNLPPGDLALPLPAGVAPGKLPEISAGLSKGAKNSWEYRVTNNFDRPVQLIVSVRQYSSTLQNLDSSKASFRLKPGESQSGKILANQKAVGCAVIMESWKYSDKPTPTPVP